MVTCRDAIAELCYAYCIIIEEIEKAVSQLPPDDLARFRSWFEEFEATRFDRKIEQDAASGRLDRLAEQAVADYRQGRAREI